MEWGSSITYLGETKVDGKPVRFGIKDADRFSHLTIIGKSGSGKPAVVVPMALQDMGRGVGTVVLDSMGNVSQAILERIPADARGRIIALDPSDGEYPYSWNPMDDFRAKAEEDPEDANVRLSELLISLYQFEGPDLAEFAAAAMLGRTDSTLLFLYNFITDAKVRERAFPSRSEKRKELEALLQTLPEATKEITENGKYLAKDTMMRNIFGQKSSKFTLQGLKADEQVEGVPTRGGSILVVNLSRIRMFPTRITPLVRTYVALARMHSASDSPVSIYLHDCLRYLSPADFEKAIFDRSSVFVFSDTSHGEEEKTLRHQALQRSASVLALSPHDTDLPAVERIFYPYVPLEEIHKLGEGEYVIALSIDSVRARPFFGKTLPLPDRSGISPRDLELESRGKYTITRLKADELFKPRFEEEREETKSGEPGSFSNAFRSIFTKRAAGGNPPPAAPPSFSGGPMKPPPPTPLPPRQTAPIPKNATTVPAPAQKGQALAKEISEEELKKLLHVGKAPQ